jgi:hypothetical protein
MTNQNDDFSSLYALGISILGHNTEVSYPVRVKRRFLFLNNTKTLYWVSIEINPDNKNVSFMTTHGPETHNPLDGPSMSLTLMPDGRIRDYLVSILTFHPRYWRGGFYSATDKYGSNAAYAEARAFTERLSHVLSQAHTDFGASGLIVRA